ncbi:hypothetical protein [Kribbella sp. CA-293567]|uniref:hypothetical protein n=1 Tax=Kribbella sp. CA-293567 TaxID=3002436 RepID=UPI0022DCEE31|nr:hypothetical protein [Kribbella sp. CA-293567]WBQ07736.1 hypothetical protein OX958_13260 [Kribbella sp. CA-293567]
MSNQFEEGADAAKDAFGQGEENLAELKRSGGDVELKRSGGDVEAGGSGKEGTDSGGDVETEPTGDPA